MIKCLSHKIKSLFFPNTGRPDKKLLSISWQANWTAYLNKSVAFYRSLSESDKTLFEQRVRLFLETTSIEAGQIEVSDEDRLLVAASAVIPVWGFPEWHLLAML